MYKSDIQFIREKYCELADENNKLRDEIRTLQKELDSVRTSFPKPEKDNGVMVYRWMKPSEVTDDLIADGDVCIALVPNRLFPIFVNRGSLPNKFYPMSKKDSFEGEPSWVLNLPPIGTGGIVINKPKNETD